MSTSLTWYGHAALGLQIDRIFLLVDPFFIQAPEAPLKPDYILITHGHADHLGDTLNLAQSSGATCIANYEICSWLSAKGLKTHAMHIGGSHQFPFGKLKLTMAAHGSQLPDGSYGGPATGFLLTTPQGQRLYLAGDTGLFGDMRLIGEEGLDLAVLPIGDNYTMGPQDALRAVRLLQSPLNIPIHYNSYELIRQDPYAWKQSVEAETGFAVQVLQAGESLLLPDKTNRD